MRVRRGALARARTPTRRASMKTMYTVYLDGQVVYMGQSQNPPARRQRAGLTAPLRARHRYKVYDTLIEWRQYHTRWAAMLEEDRLQRPRVEIRSPARIQPGLRFGVGAACNRAYPLKCNRTVLSPSKGGPANPACVASRRPSTSRWLTMAQNGSLETLYSPTPRVKPMDGTSGQAAPFGIIPRPFLSIPVIPDTQTQPTGDSGMRPLACQQPLWEL